jgi:hypothetical protein
MLDEEDTGPKYGENMTSADDLEKLIDEANGSLHLKTGIPASWIFTDWKDNKKEIVPQLDKQGKEVRRYVRVTFNNVIDIMSKDQRSKTFTTTSKKLLRKLFANFEQGVTSLEITRIGEGMQTDYDVYPITPPKEEK